MLATNLKINKPLRITISRSVSG